MSRNRTKMVFSNFFNTVLFDGKTLTIAGKKTLSAALLLVFLLGAFWCLTLNMSAVIKGGVVLSAALIAYALLDVLFSKNVFLYNIDAKYIDLHRKSMRKSIVYQGSSEGCLVVRKIADISPDDVVTNYFVQLVFDNGQANIPYQLNRRSFVEADAQKKVEQWQALLRLD